MKFKFLFSIVLLCFMVSIAWASESVITTQARIKYIQQSFNVNAQEFFQRAEGFVCIGAVYILEDESDPKTTSYYLTVNGPKGKITSVIASKQIELENNRVEIYNEGVFLDYKRDWIYRIQHYIMDRDNSCQIEDLPRQNGTWDECLNHFFN